MSNHDEIYRLGWPVALLMIAFLLVLSSGCDELVEPVCDELPAEGLDRIEIHSDGGSVEVLRVDGHGIVELDGEIHIPAVSTSSAGRRADKITLDFHAEGSTAMLVLEIPPEAQPAWGELILTVPEDFDGLIETENAPVTVEGLDGDLRVMTTNGKVTVSDVTGDLDLQSTNGKITADRTVGDARLVTTNAAVQVEDLQGDIDVDTTNGKVTLTDVLGDIAGHTTNGKVSVEAHVGSFDVNTTNAPIDLDTCLPADGYGFAASTNGSIDLDLPAAVSASLEASTTNGTIDIEGLPFDGQLHDDWASVVFGDGEAELVLSTTNGSIDVTGHGDDSSGD